MPNSPYNDSIPLAITNDYLNSLNSNKILLFPFHVSSSSSFSHFLAAAFLPRSLIPPYLKYDSELCGKIDAYETGAEYHQKLKEINFSFSTNHKCMNALTSFANK
jgi:hypothetical protein